MSWCAQAMLSRRFGAVWMLRPAAPHNPLQRRTIHLLMRVCTYAVYLYLFVLIGNEVPAGDVTRGHAAANGRYKHWRCGKLL
jgi:hypothetical protein